MRKRESRRAETHPTRTMHPRRSFGSCAIAFVVAFAGCGGEVIQPDYETEEQQPEGDDAGTGGGSGTTEVFSGKCIRCDGQPECGFCLVQIYNTTYICPPDKSAPQSGCMDLLEHHQTAAGEPFTCYYCD